MPSTTCQTCKFWTSYKGDKAKGLCRRYSPEIIPEPTGGLFLLVGFISSGVHSGWPETEYDDWCGEHESKEQPEPDKQ